MGVFKFEDDLLKHFVRTEAWLPLCRKRLRIVRSKARRSADSRRLRYFTFCAIGAIDVLMLDVARVLRRSRQNGFDTVVFFDRGDLEVLETQKRIPGARGYPSEFLEIVLLPDPAEEVILAGLDDLAAPANEPDVARTRERQRRLSLRRNFMKEFPFDVINLDLEGFLFRPNDPFPGKLIAAFRKILSWQKNPIERMGHAPEYLDGFSFMFTTQIGPPNLTDEYLAMLRQAIQGNLDRDGELRNALEQRTGNIDTEELQRANFEIFFKIALPKIILAMLQDEDWYVDPASGISVYEIERQSQDGPYKMLHIVLDVKRQHPPRERRAPGAGHVQEARDAYSTIARQIFADREVVVTHDTLDAVSLTASLEAIYERRRRYYPEVDDNIEE